METVNSASFIMENFEMLKALYDFQAVYPKTINFDEGEHFILYQTTSAKQRNWWQVVNMKGSIGFVPSNYVMKIKVEPSFMFGFLDSSIESLELLKEEDVNGIISRVELIEKLRVKKAQAAISAKILESDAESMFDNEKRYTTVATVDDTSEKSSAVSKKGPPTKSFVPESPSMPKLEDPGTTPKSPVTGSSTNTAGHDNSITSEPSEATTTISDETTIISLRDPTPAGTPVEAKVKSSAIPLDGECAVNERVPNGGSPEGENSKLEITAPASPTPSIIPEIIEPDLEPSTSASVPNQSEVLRVDSSEVYQIIDSVRQTTGLSHKMSCVALQVILSELETIYSTRILHLLEPIAIHLNDSSMLQAPDEFVEHTNDSQRLKVIFSKLSDCKNDSEQRSWMLHEDEAYIIRFLTDLIEILTNADRKICKFELSCDQYQSIVNLIQYYQMEIRWTIRQLLIDSFRALCFVDVDAIDVMLTSVLPLELVQDMQSNLGNVERLRDLAKLLTLIFALGLKMPINQREHIGAKFVLFLMNLIEQPTEHDYQDQVSDTMIDLLLAFNLQFDEFADSLVLDGMRQVKSAKTFTEKILVLLNREDDPLNLFEDQPKRPTGNSVLKMFVDLFATRETAGLFYTNDNKVLIDILVRQLSDLSAGDPLRRTYLELCRRIVRNTDYAEHSHRKPDLMKVFTRIFCEEGECSLRDQQLVREIANEFPQIFKA